LRIVAILLNLAINRLDQAVINPVRLWKISARIHSIAK
jgi:hypothetical protein